jgi:hypothetical protein
MYLAHLVLLRTHVRARAGPARNHAPASCGPEKTKTPSGGAPEGVLSETKPYLPDHFSPLARRRRDDDDEPSPCERETDEVHTKERISNMHIGYDFNFVKYDFYIHYLMNRMDGLASLTAG